jgi:WD40 repeat protein
MAMQQQIVLERTSHTPVQAAAIAPERREFFTMSDDHFIKTWHVDTGQLVRTVDAHRGKITALLWVSSLRFVASASLDHSLAIWDFKGNCIARAKFPTALYSAGYSAKHNAFIVGGVKKMFIVKLVQNRDDWDFLIDKEFSEHTDFISQIICTPLGRIFSCGYDGLICAFEQNVSEQIVVMSVGHDKNQVYAKAKCHKGAITCATFNTETGTLITGGYDMLVKIWNSDSLTAHAQYIPLSTLDLNKTIISLAYVAATRMVWVGTAGLHKPHLMDPRTGTNLTDFQPHIDLKPPLSGEHPTCLVASSDMAISASDQKRLTIWRYNPLACVASIHGHTDWVEFVLAHPVSSQWGFITAGADSTVRCWHSPSALYPELYSLKDVYCGHEGSVVAGVIKVLLYAALSYYCMRP